MWQRIPDSEIQKRLTEAAKVENGFKRLAKKVGIWLAVGFGITFLEITANFFFAGNYIGKTFRHPWYSLSEHWNEIPIIFMKSLIFGGVILLFRSFFFGKDDTQAMAICLKCQLTQYPSAKCIKCGSPELIDFKFVEWIPKKRKPAASATAAKQSKKPKKVKK